MTNRKRTAFLAWRAKQIAAAKANDEEMFLGKPETWYEAGCFGCENGHVSTRILKSEAKGDLCLACSQPVLMIPPELTDETLLAALTPADQC